ncbi:MAG: flagellar biosynthesis protein FlhF [Phycisphaerales bacterium]|nr:flagellar biosynthesis protein FlhF [Phycisphaerales bacterium]
MATTTHRSPLRTFHAPTMADALAEVKRDLGPDAVILHTRSYRVGGVMGVGAREIVEITASADPGVVRPRRVRPRAAETDAGLTLPEERIGRPHSGESFVPTPPWFQPTRRADEDVVRGRPVSSLAGATYPRPDPRPEPHPEPRTDDRAQTRPVPRPASLVEAKPGATGPIGGAAPGHALPVPPTGPPPLATPKPAPRLAATRVEPAPTNSGAHAALEEELAAIRRLVGQVLQSSRRAEVRAARTLEPQTGPAVSTGPLFDLYLRLVDNQVRTELADDLVSAVRDQLSGAELADAVTVRDAMLRALTRAISVVGDPRPPVRAEHGRPAVVALVGPTGVGKTTTVAKLAATYKLRHGRKVGLVTADTYRIAAVEQLRTYADIVGLPLKVALSPQDMEAAVEALSDCEVVLIDTAGRSQHDASRLGELREFLDAAKPECTHLVLSLAAAESVILAAAERFGALAPGRLILTKLDETVDFGVLANIAARVKLPLSYVTTGQEVPDHIEPASAERLARLVLDGQAAWKVYSGGV